MPVKYTCVLNTHVSDIQTDATDAKYIATITVSQAAQL